MQEDSYSEDLNEPLIKYIKSMASGDWGDNHGDSNQIQMSNWLIEPSFIHAESFKNSMTKVWLSGKMGYINRSGKFVYKDW